MRFVPIGWRYAGIVVAIGLFVAIVLPPVGVSVFIVAGGVLWFFRDPTRHPAGDGILAPADGRVSVIEHDADRIRIGTYMSVADVHVNRAPASGSITHVEHRAGGYWPAFSKASDRNERVEFELGSDVGSLEVSLIAGSVARRITPYVEKGDSVEAGDRIGHIAFGSRVDVRLPRHVHRDDLLVERGDRVTAGETVIAPRIDGSSTESDEPT